MTDKCRNPMCKAASYDPDDGKVDACACEDRGEPCLREDNSDSVTDGDIAGTHPEGGRL